MAVAIVAMAAFAAACTESGGELSTLSDTTSDTTAAPDTGTGSTATTTDTGTSADTPDQNEGACGDGVCAPTDNCPTRYNLNQLDIDSDDLGDACDTCPDQPGGDTDADGKCDVEDNCVSDYNPDQLDTNGDGVGDACDPCPASADADHDTICDDTDRCEGGDDRIDVNSDGIPDACEACQWQTRRRWNVIYHDLMTYNGEGPFAFEVSLYENGEIAFQYDHMHNLAGPTVGLESPSHGFSLPYMFPTINLPDRTRLEFSPMDGGFNTRISSDPGGPVFDWLEHPTGVPRLVLGDDESAVVTLPFAFPWMDRVYTSINVSSNGYLWFGAPSQQNCCDWQQERLPTTHTWLGLIAPAWFDLNPIYATGDGHVAAWGDEERCVIDCTGAAHGSARLDVCGECAGGTTGKRPGFALDCHGDCFGVAYLDACGVCIGGNTGLHHSNADQGCGCFEDPARAWYIDTDGDALGAGDPTVACRQEVPPGYVSNDDDLEPNCATNDTTQCGTCGALDCTGVCHGGAAVDPCGVCAGGNTGIIPSPPDDLNGDGYPDACNGPDLVVDEPYLRQHLSIDHVFVAPNDCYINEGCVGGPGDRKVLRFGTMIGNIGNADLAIGPPGQDPEYWEYDACHDHYHYEDYAFYQLFTEAGHELSSIGYKNGWCVLDLTEYGPGPAPNGCNTYSCGNQGISAGCADIYSSALACQWIDVTAVPDGVYTLRVITNPRNHVRELRYDNNAAEVTVRIQGDVVTLMP